MFKGNINNNVRKLNKIVIILCVSGENTGKLGEKTLLYHKCVGGNTYLQGHFVADTCFKYR